MGLLKLPVVVQTMFLFAGFHAYPQEVNWISFNELTNKMRTEPKSIVVFIHTDWCKFCAMQENSTFSDPKVVNELNENFYPVRLNAEEKNDIIFLNRQYRYKPSGAGTGYHELAELLGKKDGKMSFPSTILLSKSWQVVKRETGFLTSNQFLEFLAK